MGKTGFIILLGILLIAFVAVMPKTTASIKNKITNIDQKISAEQVVENYQADYVRLTNKKQDIKKALNDFNVQIRVFEKKLENETELKNQLFKKLNEFCDSNDSKSFNICKTNYETQIQRIKALEDTIAGYKTAVEKLSNTLNTIDMNLVKAKMAVDTISSRKTMADNFSQLNTILKNLNGCGEDISLELEQLDEKLITESAQLEVFQVEDERDLIPVTSKEDMQEYINSQK